MEAEPSPFRPEHFRRFDEGDDAGFYREPRLVTHIDDGAIDALTALYRQVLPSGGAILDLMSSWISHLPPEVAYSRVAGLGMNPKELAANPRLTERAVQNLNENPELPYEDVAFDAAMIAVSVQYLTRPVEVFASLGRVLRDGAPVVISFSNRCFPTKAVAVWQLLGDREHADLVGTYFRLAGCYGPVQAIDLRPGRRPGDDPMYAVIAHRLARAAEKES